MFRIKKLGIEDLRGQLGVSEVNEPLAAGDTAEGKEEPWIRVFKKHLFIVTNLKVSPTRKKFSYLVFGGWFTLLPLGSLKPLKTWFQIKTSAHASLGLWVWFNLFLISAKSDWLIDWIVFMFLLLKPWEMQKTKAEILKLR